MRKILRDKKAISTILAALLMVVIVVVASVMVYAWSTGLLGTLLVKPDTGDGPLTLESYSFPGAQNVSLFIRNQGTAAVTLQAYYVLSSTGSQYSRLTWTTTAIDPNQVRQIQVLINTACGSNCSLSGNAFQFDSGFSYTVRVVTSRNTPFEFSVVR